MGFHAYAGGPRRRWLSLPPHPLEAIERLEQLRPLAAGLPIGVAITREAPATGIDTEEDLERANARWDAFMAGAFAKAGEQPPHPGHLCKPPRGRTPRAGDSPRVSRRASGSVPRAP